MIRIPFAFLPPNVLYRFSRSFYGLAQKIEKRFPFLEIQLIQSNSGLNAIEYVSMCLVSIIFFFCLIFIVSLFSLKFGAPFMLALAVSVVITFFVFLQQLAYPKLIASKRVRGVDRNLLPALQAMLVQLNSGVPLFNILVNIAKGGYGEVSKALEIAVKEINAGRSQVEALEDLAMKNPSVLFRRALWQVVNGMKEGADIAGLIKEVIKSISDEQITQIQKYGGQLSPLALFYMLIAIIAPSLGTTFIIVLSSFVTLSEQTTKLVFYMLLVMTFFFQIMFLGMIKSRRPALLGD